jgi:hypothetical protein
MVRWHALWDLILIFDYYNFQVLAEMVIDLIWLFYVYLSFVNIRVKNIYFINITRMKQLYNYFIQAKRQVLEDIKTI